MLHDTLLPSLPAEELLCIIIFLTILAQTMKSSEDCLAFNQLTDVSVKNYCSPLLLAVCAAKSKINEWERVSFTVFSIEFQSGKDSAQEWIPAVFLVPTGSREPWSMEESQDKCCCMLVESFIYNNIRLQFSYNFTVIFFSSLIDSICRQQSYRWNHPWCDLNMDISQI